MTQARWTAAIVAALVLFAASSASAAYRLSAVHAATITRGYVSGHDGYARSTITTACHPQDLPAPASGSDHHRWVCQWSRGARCRGAVRVVGTALSRHFTATAIKGYRCPAPDTIQSVPAPAPAPAPSGCNPNYTGACLNKPGDYDCAGGSGNGPNYTGTVTVVGDDPYDLDADGNGIGCQ